MKKTWKTLLSIGMAFALLLQSSGLAVRAEETGTTADAGALATSGTVSCSDLTVEEPANVALRELAEEQPILAVVYLSDIYPLRAEASYDGAELIGLPSGTTVFIKDACRAEDGTVWEYIEAIYGQQTYQGYIPRDYLACSDERFLVWEQEYGMTKAAPKLMLKMAKSIMSTMSASAVSYADVEQFPASYQPAMKALKEKHPNWIFVPMNTGLDWNTVIANEIIGGKSLVHKSFPAYTKEGAYDDGNWFYASEEILKLYMDPRNALQEDAIFQFEQLTYNETYHTVAALDQFLAGTFMNSNQNAPNLNMTYAFFITAIGKEEKVSPFHLAARIYQEQGEGTSPLISGTYPGYEGLYNYFNIGATGTTQKQIIENGLTYARNANPQWNNAYYSIAGGASVIAGNYIVKGQDTLYLQKFNVNPLSANKLYTHQYMQNISAPTSEAKSIKALYQKAGALESTFVFKIPVYNNMPDTACPSPTSSTNVVLQIPSGYDTTVFLDGVAYTPQVRNNRYIVKAPNATMTNAVVYKYNENNVPVGMYVWTLDYANGAYTATAQPELTDLLSYHGFSIRIVGKSGIRFKSGISTALRTKLSSDGVNGYKLKEYGTLIMRNSNRSTYPMVLGGQKVVNSVSYGLDSDGNKVDTIYETVDGRYRYTSVLVGMPATEYPVEYAFRGYTILEKNGKQTVIYGPAMARSIYALAEQVLAMGSYSAGSDADQFLRKLIADADAITAAENTTP